ncbi:unnamed protein product [Bursaphelenchus okinawaensis]|uniref:Molybdopterin synthase catalytic subunit n=1 Tax=Bursaphelenchus okinawaensis TaxID=465554 RepID=A0A811JSK5_9BILA|nr:unnamed protein product [Bursaphelenchus okinawaensis]CAG9080639.1 unnamed protein product [Bursaphelenchus okinawaensis]
MGGKVLAIAGCTNAGKTTLSKTLTQKISEIYKYSITHILQDDFFYTQDKVRTIQSNTDDSIVFYDYDSPRSLDVEKLKETLIEAKKRYEIVILEGNLLTLLPTVMENVDKMLFLSLDKKTCAERRVQRTDYDPPDMPGYFEQVVWPVYEETLSTAEKMSESVEIVDGNRSDLVTYALMNLFNTFGNYVRLTTEQLNVEAITNTVASDQAGGISIFIGTTRDNFEGKSVTTLFYEAYEPMAYQELWLICKEVRSKYPNLRRICIHHLLGECPVGKKSVVIATSSPHRKDTIDATEFIIDTLKVRVPIWKKEIYKQGSGEWKENKESLVHINANSNGKTL